MIFRPTTERGRIYAALVDCGHALEYIAETFLDDECAVVAKGIKAAKIAGHGAETVTAKILAVPGSYWHPVDLIAVLNITKPGGEWFRRLIEECGETRRIEA